MSHLSEFPAAILETVLAGLMELFLAGADGNRTAARDAAAHMLGGYHPRSVDELRLAASVIAFSFQALQALGQAAAPDIRLTRALRLNGIAVSLSRESAKAERRLAQERKAAQEAIPALTAEIGLLASPIQPTLERSPVAIRDARRILAIAKANGITWN